MTRNISRAPLRTLGWLVLGLSGTFLARPALAGPTLVSRESGLRAAGVSAAGEYNLSNGSGDFGTFADSVGSDNAADAARSRAEQNSSPRLDGAAGAFAGDSAAVAARAAVDATSADAYASAESDFDLVFRIEGNPARVLLDCTLGATGDATAGVKLYDTQTLEPAFSDEVSADSRASRGEKILAPGTYGVSVWAFVRGTPDNSSATYSVNLSLASDAPTPSPVPMPLPAALWGGAVTLALIVAGTVLARRRQAHAVR